MEHRNMKVKLFNEFVSLFEARDWDQIRQYYLNRKSNDGYPMSDELGVKILNADPTENKMYVRWMIFKAFTNMDLERFESSLRTEANELLRIFDRAKNSLPVESRDLMTSCEDFSDLRGLVRPFIEDPTLLLSKKQLSGDTPVEGQYKIIYSNSNWDVIVPFTHSASCYWGSGARWCTAYSGNSYHFDRYTKRGNLFIFRHKTDKNERYQMHIIKKEFNNKENSRVNISFFNDKPDLITSVFMFLKSIKKKRHHDLLFLWLLEGRVESAIMMFLDNGLKVDFLDKYRKSPLLLALRRNDIELIDILLEKGANPLFEVSYIGSKKTAIDEYASSVSQINKEIFYKLIDASTKNSKKSKKSISIVQVFENLMRVYHNILNSDIDIIETFFVDFNFDFNEIVDGKNMFHVLFRNLTGIEANVDVKNVFETETFKRLLGSMANSTLQDDNGNTYLHLIFISYNKDYPFVDEIIKMLIEKNPDIINIRNNAGKLPFDVIKYGFKDKWVDFIKPDDVVYDEKYKLMDYIEHGLVNIVTLRPNKVTINDDMSIDVDHDIYMGYSSLKEIPIKFNVVNGDFYCNNNALTSLKNAPKIVNGNFSCKNNNLLSLEGGPIEIKGNYDIDGNRDLTSLKYSPEEIGGSFSCQYTSITTLKDGPKVVNGIYYADSTNITTNEGLPIENYKQGRYRISRYVEDVLKDSE